MTLCLQDSEPFVRRQTLILLTNLLQEDYVKWRGSLFFHFLTSLVDQDKDIRLFGILMQNGCFIVLVFLVVLFPFDVICCVMQLYALYCSYIFMHTKRIWLSYCSTELSLVLYVTNRCLVSTKQGAIFVIYIFQGFLGRCRIVV